MRLRTSSIAIALLFIQQHAVALAFVPAISHPGNTAKIIISPSIDSSEGTTVIGYKNSDYEDDNDTEYPIPVGRFNPPVVNGVNSNRVLAIPSSPDRVASSSSSTTSSHIYEEPAYDYDNCYYPIPVSGGSTSSSSSTTTTTSTPKVPAAGRSKPTIVKKPATRVASKGDVGKKPVINTITNFQDLCNFLAEDDRLTIIEFLAPWCKTCRKLKHSMNKVASDYGDVIVNRVKVKGLVRVVHVEYGPKTEYFITSLLGIRGVPTIQMYHTTNKVWDMTGLINTKDVVSKIEEWLAITDPEERLEHSTNLDDGVLQTAIDNCFYDDYPDFLDEEW